jgi:drug/metabolite transporter (DMT)-like permease
MKPTNTLRGALFMLGFCILAPLLDASSKLATEAIPVGQITAARFVFQGLCMLPVFLLLRLDWRVSRRDLTLLIARAFCLMLSTFCFVASVQYMPIANAIAIVFVMPFMLMFLGKIIFGNPIGSTRILASIVGFAGAMLIIRPSLNEYGLVALFPLGCAFAFSFYEMATQAMSNRVPPVTMQLHTSLAGATMCLPLLWASNAVRHPLPYPACAELTNGAALLSLLLDLRGGRHAARRLPLATARRRERRRRPLHSRGAQRQRGRRPAHRRPQRRAAHRVAAPVHALREARHKYRSPQVGEVQFDQSGPLGSAPVQKGGGIVSEIATNSRPMGPSWRCVNCSTSSTTA